MKTIKTDIGLILGIVLCALIMACSDESECSGNSKVDGECFNAEAIDYNLQTINGSISITRENLTIAFKFPNSNSERYALTIRSDADGSTHVDGMQLVFEENIVYETANSFRYNGNLNSNTIGELTVTFSKVDRVNGLVSGSFTFIDRSDQFGDHPSFGGNFTDVNVAFQ